MKLWKRNAIAAAIVLFVCGAVYLNWNYTQDTETGKNLGEAALVGSQRDDLLKKDSDQAKGETKTEATQSGTYFSTARLNRQQARDNALSLLQEAAQDEKTRPTLPSRPWPTTP